MYINSACGVLWMANKILVIEDDTAISELICMNLDAADYQYDCAYDGKYALTLIEKEKYDLALLDIMLPYKDGFELMGYLVEKAVPVIFLTARSEIADKVKGFHMGAEDYIVKPFETLELLARVEAVLKRHGVRRETLKVNHVELDSIEMCVRSKGNIVNLKPKEYELLETLMRNKNIALSREKLLELVWSYDYDGGTRTVDVHIQMLRKKLCWEDCIKTIYKMGYRLEEN